MATIRARLTAWNSLVLVLILLVFAVAAYVFLQNVTVAQVDRSLRQQMRASVLAAQEAEERGKTDTAAMRILTRELGEVGLDVVNPVSIPNAVVTVPERLATKGERPDAQSTTPASAVIEWTELDNRLNDPKRAAGPFTVPGVDGGARAMVQTVPIASRQIMLVSLQPLGVVTELLETARLAALIALPVALLLSLFSGYALARRALAPVASMTAEARSIGARNLNERLSIQSEHDELGQLAVTFNNVLERVELALEQQRRFTADASHELRTPIALIRAEADVALSDNSRGGNEDEYRAALNVIRDGSQQLSRVVNDLFLLARADGGQTMVTPHEMRLDDLVRATSYGMRALAEEKGLELRINVNGSAPYQGDEEMLRRILRNLIDNAIKYSAGPGVIDVSLTRDSSTYRVTVADTGQGISPEAQGHIFERFFRGDAARGHVESASGSGAGLGLAIAREIAEMHGGRVELSSSNGKGSTFELILPASA